MTSPTPANINPVAAVYSQGYEAGIRQFQADYDKRDAQAIRAEIRVELLQSRIDNALTYMNDATGRGVVWLQELRKILEPDPNRCRCGNSGGVATHE